MSCTKPKGKRLPPLAELIRTLPGYDPYRQAEGSWFDAKLAQSYIDFIEQCCTHAEGSLAGQPLLLEPWQKAFIANLFGWQKRDRLGRIGRRFRECLFYVPRKNGKTPLAAAICLAVLFKEPEVRGQIYGAAADREQAALLFTHAVGMCENEPEMKGRVKFYRSTGQRAIEHRRNKSVYKVLSAEAHTKHGQNPSLILIDELHAQPNSELVDTLATGAASLNRKSPLIIYLTTADFDRPSICNEKHKHATAVRDNPGDPSLPGYDPGFLPVLYEAADDDDWTDPVVWAKANPNLGVSVSEDYLARQAGIAKETPRLQGPFRRLHLNVRTRSASRWLRMDLWDLCTSTTLHWEQLRGKPCFGGLDMSSTCDLTSLVLVFPEPSGIVTTWPMIWVPRGTAERHERDHAIPYSVWAKAGHCVLTEGDAIDEQAVREGIRWAHATFSLKGIGFDPYNAGALAVSMTTLGIRMEAVRQGFLSLNEPSKRLERMLLTSQLVVPANHCYRWTAENADAQTDPTGSIKPVKGDHKGPNKIDPLIATVMALAIAGTDPGVKESIYSKRGLL